MAPLLLRSIARSTPTTASRLLRRNISASTSLRQTEPAAASAAAKNAFDYHTVEDIQHMSAADLLTDPESRKGSQMRHFTGVFLVLVYVVIASLTKLAVNFG